MALFQLEYTHMLGIGAVLLCLSVLWQLFLSPLRGFPGPFVAKFTDIWRAAAVLPGQIDKVNRRWHKKYGSAVRVGPNAIILNDPEMIKTVYSTKKAWVKSDMYMINDVLINGKRLANVFNTRDLAWHAQQIKPISKFFSMSRLMDIEPLLDVTINMITSKLNEKVLAWDSMANVTFGRHYGFIEKEQDVDGLIEDSVNSMRYFAPVCQIPWLDYLLDKNPIKRIGPKPQLTGTLYAVRAISEYKQEIAEKGLRSQNVPHLLDKYLGLDEQHPGMVNDAQLMNWLLPTVIAGGDTTASAMRAVVYFLAKNPEAKQKLFLELDQASLETPAQWKDLKELVYLDAVIREAMRMVVFLPAGTKVGLNPAVTSRDPGVFGAEVDSFVPERWLKQDGEEETAFSQRFRRMHEVLDFVFGAGTRVCLGKNLAKLEIYKAIATIYSLYDINLVDPTHEWKHYSSWFVYQLDIPTVISRRD
ncbi:hypothetical protein CEP52_002143 [Fusarium oligoseptatum]|uniref:Cytochrome P450 monooxygenase n=1 Tax=Fusarium oligoseptatum TaxID=2604345 RepID=A0A428UFW1_9HYPO|nr:hypothetical protein CEP52_002143 [Fusarium oligoseptatum]